MLKNKRKPLRVLGLFHRDTRLLSQREHKKKVN